MIAKRKYPTGAEHPQWKGGRRISSDGYVLLYMPNHPNAKNNKYVFEHRFLMSKLLKRPLKKFEQVHHRNGIKNDNRLENLELMMTNNHKGRIMCPYCNKKFTIR